MFLETILQTQKSLIIGLYKLPNRKVDYFLKILGVFVGNYLSNYEDIIFLGDFN